MVCNTALLVRNQTSAIMSVYSLNHYHAEWPLMTEPWINAEGCEPTDARDPSCLVAAAAAAPNNLYLLPRTTAVNQQISAFGVAPRSERSSAAAGCTDPDSVSRVSSLSSKTFYFTSTFFIRLTIWNLAPSVSWSPPASVLFVLHYPVITGTLLKVWGSCTYLCSSSTSTKAYFKIKSACSAMLLPSPLSTPLSLPLFTLPSSLASRTDEQMLPRDRFHINDYWLLTPNEAPLSDQCRIHLGAELICLGREAEARFVVFLYKRRGNPLIQVICSETNWMKWGLTLWCSGGTQQSLAMPWGGAPPNLQTGRERRRLVISQIKHIFVLSFFDVTGHCVTLRKVTLPCLHL